MYDQITKDQFDTEYKALKDQYGQRAYPMTSTICEPPVTHIMVDSDIRLMVKWPYLPTEGDTYFRRTNKPNPAQKGNP